MSRTTNSAPAVRLRSRDLVSFLRLLLFCLTCSSTTQVTAAPVQTWATPINAFQTGMVGNGTTLNIAVVVNCLHPLLPSPLSAPQILDTSIVPIINCSFGLLGTTFNNWWQTHTTFKRVVAEQGGIPTETGFLAQLNIVYFNVGGIDFTANTSTITAQYTSAVTNALILSQQLGAYGGYNVATNTFDAPCPHCPLPTAYITPGVYGRFPIIFPPVFSDNIADVSDSPAVMSETFFRGCQLSKQCIVIGQFSSSENWMRCRTQPQYISDPSNPAVPLLVNTIPMECNKSVDPTLRIDKRLNQRRFDYGFTALPSQSNMLSQLVSWFRLKGASTAVLFITAGTDYQDQVLAAGLDQLASNNIHLMMPVVIFPNRRPFTTGEAESYASQVVGLNPDLVIMVANLQTNDDVASTVSLLQNFRTARWTPKAIVIPGGAASLAATEMNQLHPGDGGYYYGATFLDYRFRGGSYRAETGTDQNPNWEPFPISADGLKYSPEVMMDEYIKDWGDDKPVGIAKAGDVIPLLASVVSRAHRRQVKCGTMSGSWPLVIATKIFYAAGIDDATLMQQASLPLTTPSIVGLLQFDQFGRLASNQQFVVQYGKTGTDYHLITPFDVGEPDVYPMPTWEERVAPTEGSASFLGTSTEMSVVAVTTIVNAYLLALLIGVVMKRNTALIKAASPMFCGLALIGGMICVSSNYGNSFYAVSSGCGANVWLLTTGFTMLFSALFVKTWRIWKIFQSGKLQVVKIKDTDLYIIVGVLVGIDILVNIIWSGVTGFPTEYVTVDPHRALYDYVQCHYSSQSLSFVYFHLTYKSLLVVAGMALAIAARSVPAMFNETPALISSTYNCTLILIFLIPLVASGVGGRHVNYLICSYGLLVLIGSTASLLFVPKFITLFLYGGDAKTIGLGKANATHGDSNTHVESLTPPVSNGKPAEYPADGNMVPGKWSHGSKKDMVVLTGGAHTTTHLSTVPDLSKADETTAAGTVLPLSPTQTFRGTSGDDAATTPDDTTRQSRLTIAQLRSELQVVRQRLTQAGLSIVVQPTPAPGGSYGLHRSSSHATSSFHAATQPHGPVIRSTTTSVTLPGEVDQPPLQQRSTTPSPTSRHYHQTAQLAASLITAATVNRACGMTIQIPLVSSVGTPTTSPPCDTSSMTMTTLSPIQD